ncbi:DNA cytosine methyltransferase [Streptomyces sp. SID9944]|nr:DNA cytosine methyltransferase [Streptomyces sp. SID9944]
MSLRIGSLCSGYRGLDMAVEEVFGASTAWVSDIDPGANKILAHRWPGTPNLGDLTATRWEDVEPVDIVCGGYPCQPFSTAGLRKGTDDERHIWPYIANALRVLRPRIAIFENVAGHLRLGFDTVLADLARLGFDAEWCLVRASEVGAPHQRNRLFVLATAADTTAADEGRLLGSGGAAEPAGWTEPRHSVGPAADAANLGHERGRRAWGRRPGPPDGRIAAADTDRGELPWHPERDRWQTVEQPERAPRVDADGRGVQRAAVADADSLGRGAGERDIRQGQPDAAWGRFLPAVRRWEAVTGRFAPRATDDRNRLSPAFVEWLMGLPAGHVTDVPDMTRTEQLKALGNGVVPQQAAAAIRLLHQRATDAASAQTSAA